MESFINDMSVLRASLGQCWEPVVRKPFPWDPGEVEDQQQLEIRNQGSERSQRQSAVLLALASTLGAEL